jgi:hypothetical protein
MFLFWIYSETADNWSFLHDLKENIIIIQETKLSSKPIYYTFIILKIAYMFDVSS